MSVTTVSNHFSTTYAYDLNFLKIIVEFKVMLNNAKSLNCNVFLYMYVISKNEKYM